MNPKGASVGEAPGVSKPGLVLLLLLSMCLACAARSNTGPPLALEYQGRAWAMEDVEGNRTIECDLPPGKVDPGPYPYTFQVTRAGDYYLLFSLVLSGSEASGGNRLEVSIDDRVIETYAVGRSTGGRDRLDIKPENPAVIRMGRLEEGPHSLEFRAESPGGCCIIHWGVANEAAMKEFWQRRRPWLDRPL